LRFGFGFSNIDKWLEKILSNVVICKIHVKNEWPKQKYHVFLRSKQDEKHDDLDYFKSFSRV